MLRRGVFDIASGRTVNAEGRMFGFAGKLELLDCGAVQSPGSLSDGTVVDGKWSAQGLAFRLLHNGCLYYDYSLGVEGPSADGEGVHLNGTWMLGIARAVYVSNGEKRPNESGTIQFTLRPTDHVAGDGDIPSALDDSVCEIR